MKINVPSNPDTQWLAFNISDASIQSLHTYLSWAKIYWIFKVYYSNILNTDTIYNLLSKSQPVQLSIFTHRNSTMPLYFVQIHWFSIFNSFMMVIFLVGLVSMILMRTLRKDYARYSKEEDLDDMVGPLSLCNAVE